MANSEINAFMRKFNKMNNGSSVSASSDSQIYAVDFDGTICENDYPNIGAVKTDVVAALIMLKGRGDKLILWTCREGKELDEAITFCEELGLSFDAVNANIDDEQGSCKKVHADYYFDDKNLLESDITGI